jgi:hypothetical protein
MGKTGAKMREDTPRPSGARPDKRLRLLLWFLLYKVPALDDISRKQEIDACIHCHLTAEFMEVAKRESTKQWSNMLAKRDRRRVFLKEHGFIHDGWTPPAPNEPRSRNFPTWALMKRATGEEKMVYLLRLAIRGRWNRDNTGE